MPPQIAHVLCMVSTPFYSAAIRVSAHQEPCDFSVVSLMLVPFAKSQLVLALSGTTCSVARHFLIALHPCLAAFDLGLAALHSCPASLHPSPRHASRRHHCTSGSLHAFSPLWTGQATVHLDFHLASCCSMSLAWPLACQLGGFTVVCPWWMRMH